MKKVKQVLGEALNRNLNVSLTHQRMNNWSIELYTGYVATYQKVFYTDGHSSPKEAAKHTLEFLKTL